MPDFKQRQSERDERGIARLQEETAELQALRDENDSLHAECQELRAENKQFKDTFDEMTGLLPPSYDNDDSPEGIIVHFLKDMQNLGQIVAKLTADYR
jgi:predicted nuclease with TOPRIM domain